MRIKTILKLTKKNIFRQKFISFACILVFFLVFILINIFSGLFYTSYKYNKYFEEKFSIFVFFNNDCDDNLPKVNDFKNVLGTSDLVKNLEYKTSQEIHDKYYDIYFKDNEIMLKNKPTNPCSLLSELKIYPKNIEAAKELNKKILIYKETGDYPIYTVNFAFDQAQTYQQLIKFVQIGIAVFILLLLMVIFVITSLSIELSIRSRMDEIGIMQLVGAKNRNIKSIFVWEGIIYGLVGSIIAVITTLLFGAYIFYLINSLTGNDLITNFKSVVNINAIISLKLAIFVIGEILIGAIIGGINHSIVIRKFV